MFLSVIGCPRNNADSVTSQWKLSVRLIQDDARHRDVCVWSVLPLERPSLPPSRIQTALLGEIRVFPPLSFSVLTAS